MNMFLDVIPPSEREIRMWNREAETAAKERAKAQKKAAKEKAKAEKKAAKERAKAEKKAAKEKAKAEKKAAKERKNAEKQSQDLSSAPANTVATVRVGNEDFGRESSMTAVPTGSVMMVCAALVVCIGAAWLYKNPLALPFTRGKA